jgi:hypothetical protein
VSGNVSNYAGSARSNPRSASTAPDLTPPQKSPASAKAKKFLNFDDAAYGPAGLFSRAVPREMQVRAVVGDGGRTRLDLGDLGTLVRQLPVFDGF